MLSAVSLRELQLRRTARNRAWLIAMAMVSTLAGSAAANDFFPPNPLKSLGERGFSFGKRDSPPTEERRELRRARQEAERQRLVNLFVDEAAGDQALFCTPAGECYADLIIENVRQTWPVRSKTFRAEYVRYLKRQFERLTDTNASLAVTFGPALKKSGINAASTNSS